ncbi:MAG: DICT sensory domain-containing protein [Haloferacaceae archaeon]
MTLRELIEGVEAHEKTLTVFDPDPGVVEALEAHFGDRNLVVECASAERGPRNYAVLGQDGEFMTAVGVDDLLDPGAQTESGMIDAPYRPILDHLDETMFTSYDRERMLAASREIEDRAWRSESGALHAGFQYPSNVEPQREAYERLGNRGDLSVHVYAAPGDPLDPLDGVTLHIEDCAEIRRSWFVVFDGGGLRENMCALVAEKRGGKEGFYGFWTYDPSTVDYVLNHLEATYETPESDDSQTASGV